MDIRLHSGVDVRESQRPVNPGKGTSLEGQETGVQIEPTPYHGESLGTRDLNGRPNSGARVRKLVFSWDYIQPQDTRGGTAGRPKPFLAVG